MHDVSEVGSLRWAMHINKSSVSWKQYTIWAAVLECVRARSVVCVPAGFPRRVATVQVSAATPPLRTATRQALLTAYLQSMNITHTSQTLITAWLWALSLHVACCDSSVDDHLALWTLLVRQCYELRKLRGLVSYGTETSQLHVLFWDSSMLQAANKVLTSRVW